MTKRQINQAISKADNMEQPDVVDFLKIHAEHQLLKYLAGHHIQCKCGAIMDFRKIAHIEFTTGETVTICLDCYNSEGVQKVLRIHADKIKETIKYRKA